MARMSQARPVYLHILIEAALCRQSRRWLPEYHGAIHSMQMSLEKEVLPVETAYKRRLNRNWEQVLLLMSSISPKGKVQGDILGDQRKVTKWAKYALV